LLMRITLLSSRSDPKSCSNAGTGRAENSWVRSRSSSRESRGLRTNVVTILQTGPARTMATCSTVQQHIFQIV
jgi:hypothetical protein